MSSPDLSWMIGRRIAEIRLVEPVSWWFDLLGGGSIRADTLWRIVAGDVPSAVEIQRRLG